MTELWRLSGAGNDFLALLEPPNLPSASQIAAWCRRGVSLGADGVFVLERDGDATGKPVVRMSHFNADGGRARLCVNGTRCAAQLAFHAGWADESVTLLTDAGEIPARAIDDSTIELSPPLPAMLPIELPLVGSPEAFDVPLSAHWLRVGVPHVILNWPRAVATCPLETLGPRWRSDPRLGEGGANVNCIHRRSAHDLEIRTWERGVEGETLACGSGVLASVAWGLHAGELEFPIRVQVVSGFVLTVDGEFDRGTIQRWSLVGDARLVATCRLHPGSSSFRSPPSL